ncbi:MAG: hypothetical protein IPP88_17705 [Betaproteobacteria bacterium]|nr:hypothetical protein [Betaproteobacteria bacterium]
MKMLCASVLLSATVFSHHARADIGPPLDKVSKYEATQAAYRSSLRERIQAGNQAFERERQLRLAIRPRGESSQAGIVPQTSNDASLLLPPTSEILVLFARRVTLQVASQYVSKIGGRVLALLRTVGNDQLSMGAPDRMGTPAVDKQLAQDFRAYLDARDNHMQAEFRRTTPGSSGRQHAEANLRWVQIARVSLEKHGMTLDGLLVNVPDEKLAEVTSLPDGSTILMAEFQSDTRRNFAIPLDILNSTAVPDR